jgi:histone H3/H4
MGNPDDGPSTNDNNNNNNINNININNNNNNNNNNADPKEFRKALQHAVCKIVLQQDRLRHTRTSPAAIHALTELTFQYAIQAMIPDLYAFSSHANRKSTISPEDVAMILRKLPQQQYQQFRLEFCTNKCSHNNNSGRNGQKSGSISKTSVLAASSNNSNLVSGRKCNRGDALGLALSLSPSSSSTSSDEETTDKFDIRERPRTWSSRQSKGASATTASSRLSQKRKTPQPIFKLDDDDNLDNSDDESDVNVHLQPTTVIESKSGGGEAETATTHTSFTRVHALKKRNTNKDPKTNHTRINLHSYPSLEGFSSSSSSESDDVIDDSLLSDNYSKIQIKIKNNSSSNDSGNQNRNTTRATDIQHTQGLPAKSQVQEALDNQTSDSGMDPVDDHDVDDEVENELFYGTKQAKSLGDFRQKRRRLVIQENDEDDMSD